LTRITGCGQLKIKRIKFMFC